MRVSVEINMESQPTPDSFMPDRRAGVILLLESVGWNPDKLTPAQISRIRELYHLDSDIPIVELLKLDGGHHQ